MDPENRCSVRDADTAGHTGCDSTDGIRQIPDTESGFLVVRGWGKEWRSDC